MHKTAAEWSKVRAEAVTSGSVAQATNVLQMALDDIAALRASNEALRAALLPFSAVAEVDIGESEADEDTFRPMRTFNAAPLLTVGDFRRANAATEQNS